MKSIANKVKIQITGLNTFRFINLLKNNNIPMYSIIHKNNSTYAVMYVKDFKNIRKYVRLARVRVRIICRYGPLFFIERNKKRYFFLAGILLFLLINIFSSKKIVKIEINGNNYYSDKEIYEFLTKNNIDYGSRTRSISCTVIEKKLLDNFSLLTFVSANIDGNTLKINLKENDTGTLDSKKENPCNLVATKDGEIVSIITRAGVPAFKPGDHVNAGNIIVYSRIDYTNVLGENYGYEAVVADADILMKTTTEYKDIINRKYEVKKYTGKTMMVTGVKISNLYLCLTKEKCPYKYYDVETEYKTESYGYKSTPVTYYYETYREYEPVTCEYTDEELRQKSNENLEKYINKLQENSIQTIEKSVNIEIYGESAVTSGSLITIEPAFAKSEYIAEDT